MISEGCADAEEEGEGRPGGEDVVKQEEQDDDDVKQEDDDDDDDDDGAGGHGGGHGTPRRTAWTMWPPLSREVPVGVAVAVLCYCTNRANRRKPPCVIAQIGQVGQTEESRHEEMPRLLKQSVAPTASRRVARARVARGSGNIKRAGPVLRATRAIKGGSDRIGHLFSATPVQHQGDDMQVQSAWGISSV